LVLVAATGPSSSDAPAALRTPKLRLEEADPATSAKAGLQILEGSPMPISSNAEPRLLQWTPVEPLSTDLNRFLQEEGGVRRIIGRTRLTSLGAASLSGPTNAAMTLQESLAEMEEIRMDRITQRLDENGFGLFSASRAQTRTILDRGVDAIFVPEPIRLGRTFIGFSPYTAIKRRNPLALLNPIPFVISW
jgi:hypothetical protein